MITIKTWALPKGLEIPEKVFTGDFQDIQRGYLINDTIKVVVEKNGRNYFTEIWTKTDIVRSQIHVEEFHKLWKQVSERQLLEQTSYKYINEVDGKELTINVYRGPLKGNVLIQRRFLPSEKIDRFQLPSWAKNAIDISDNEMYKGVNLARYGWPTS